MTTGAFDQYDGAFHTRHPGLTGRLLQEEARKAYVVAEHVTLSFFTVNEDGMQQPLLSRHKLNNRNQVMHFSCSGNCRMPMEARRWINR